jgi:alkylation response protein AidB-like acyl-CoA dehydrogenase
MEYARARAMQPVNRVGVKNVGPTILAFGTDEQKHRWLPGILDASDLWCQLFSEPGAGSDLAALSTRAIRADGGWLVSGQKVWTSYAQFADFGILLARTDPEARKGKGISFLIVDMRSPGVTVRPLRQLTGSDEFNEVFLEEVHVPVANLVGELNEGWAIAQTTLSHERGTSPRQLVVHRILLNELLALSKTRQLGGVVAAQDPLMRQKLAQAFIEVEMTKLHNWRTLTQLRRHGEPGPESSLVKLFWSEMSQRMHDTAMDLLGVDGQLWQGEPRAVARGRWVRSYLYYRAASIFAGTNEVQRNIIAQRVLGLPR